MRIVLDFKTLRREDILREVASNNAEREVDTLIVDR